jgi:hypothetical protein
VRPVANKSGENPDATELLRWSVTESATKVATSPGTKPMKARFVVNTQELTVPTGTPRCHRITCGSTDRHRVWVASVVEGVIDRRRDVVVLRKT